MSQNYKAAAFKGILLSLKVTFIILVTALLLPFLGVFILPIDAIIIGLSCGIIGCLLIGLFEVCKKSKRSNGIQSLFFASSLCILIIPCIFILIHVRPYSFYPFTLRANTAINILKESHDQRWKNGAKLEEFDPRQLSYMPFVFSSSRYNETQDGFCIKYNASMGVLNWDEFYYCSFQNHSEDQFYRDVITSINGWIYYHE